MMEKLKFNFANSLSEVDHMTISLCVLTTWSASSAPLAAETEFNQAYLWTGNKPATLNAEAKSGSVNYIDRSSACLIHITYISSRHAIQARSCEGCGKSQEA